MNIAVSFAIGLVIAIVQTLSFPMVAIYGSPIPLAPISLLLASLIYRRTIFPVSLGLGFGLDLLATTPFGLMIIAYMLGAFTLQATMAKLDTWRWGRLLWLAAFTGVLPLYAQLGSARAMVISAWPFTLAIPVLLAVGLAIVPYYLIRKHQKLIGH